MADPGSGVRARRSGSSARPSASRSPVAAAAAPVGVTGCGSVVADAVASRLSVAGVEVRRDPASYDGLAALVHLAAGRDPAAAPALRRAAVEDTRRLLRAAAEAQVPRVVLVTSAMVFGAHADNPLPLPDDAPLRAEDDGGLLGDWLEIEREVRGDPRVAVVRPAWIVGAGAAGEPTLARLLVGPRLLVFRDREPTWQVCHVDDLADALTLVATTGVPGPVTVASEGWIGRSALERATGLRTVAVPASIAFRTAERLHRVGVAAAPSELRYLAEPWVVGATALRAAGWAPRWTTEAALAAHCAAIDAAPGSRGGRRGAAATGAAAASVAIVGSVAVARAARRRRGL